VTLWRDSDPATLPSSEDEYPKQELSSVQEAALLKTIHGHINAGIAALIDLLNSSPELMQALGSSLDGLISLRDEPATMVYVMQWSIEDTLRICRNQGIAGALVAEMRAAHDLCKQCRSN
jgi:hypothetical protein